MKYLLAILIAFLCGKVLATERVHHSPVAHPMSQQQTANPSATGGNAVGGNVSSDAWAVALPGHGSPSYAGQFSICVRGRGQFFNAFWQWDPDLECVRLIADLTRLAATPIPTPTVYPMGRPTHAEQAEAVCGPPAKAKSVQAAKKAGACKS